MSPTSVPDTTGTHQCPLTAASRQNLSLCHLIRAPELIFGATDYTTNIDVWSAGCVFAGEFKKANFIL